MKLRTAAAALAAGLAITTLSAAPAHADEDTAQAVVVVQNDSVTRWLVVVGGDGYRHDIAPRGGKANVLGGNYLRKAWVPAGCSTYKEGIFWSSAPSSGGKWKTFGFQVLQADFAHYCG